jgi:hypothetical protein
MDAERPVSRVHQLARLGYGEMVSLYCKLAPHTGHTLRALDGTDTDRLMDRDRLVAMIREIEDPTGMFRWEPIR